MTDDPLAHLYADFADDDLELPTRETSLAELLAVAPEPEELTDDDLDELALLVKARIEGPGLPDEEAAALGLGELRDGELLVNDVGRAVLKRLADRLSAAEFEDRLRALGVVL